MSPREGAWGLALGVVLAGGWLAVSGLPSNCQWATAGMMPPTQGGLAAPGKNAFRESKPRVPRKPRRPLAEDDVNLMKFLLYSQFTRQFSRRGEILSSEAKLWDMRKSPKDGIWTIRAKPGSNRIPLIEDRDGWKLLYGQVLKVDGFILFQVRLNAAEPNYGVRWWRYPNDDNFYRLHQADLALLLASKKIKEDETNQVYLVTDWFWEEMMEHNKLKVHKGGKTFQFADSAGTGHILEEAGYAKIIKLPGMPPKQPLEPSFAVWRLYPDGTRIYGINPRHFRELIANRVRVKEDDIDRVYVMHTNQFDALVDDQLLQRVGGKVYFYQNLVHGDILSRDEKVVVIRLAEKYCWYPGTARRVVGKAVRVAPYWYEGYCCLKVGYTVQDALKEPLSAELVKGLLSVPR
jgi:hypothetical protein